MSRSSFQTAVCAGSSAPTTPTDQSATDSQRLSLSESGLPPHPSAASGVRFAESQAILAEQIDAHDVSGTKSPFRMLLKAGHANVRGWLGKNGRLNYVRKCFTDVPKGLIQGLISGAVVGFYGMGATLSAKREYPHIYKDGFCSELLNTQSKALLFLGILAITNSDIEDLADDARDGRRDQHIGRYNIGRLAKEVEAAHDVTYTPSKIASFGLGAVVGAVVPSLVALVVFGTLDLGIAVKQRVSAREEPPKLPETPSTTYDSDSSVSDE